MPFSNISAFLIPSPRSQVEIVADTGALSEEGHTPRQEFIRKMISMGRVPVPILLRDPAALEDLNLAHRGLGDDVMCAAAEVILHFSGEQWRHSKLCGFIVRSAGSA